MASSALEEKINKIRLQNEEIRRRYEEVEADKKNAAKLNALVQLVPSDDWPERREPPEFSAPPKTVQKQKSVTKDRENERPSQHYSGIQERMAKKEHKFAEGDGPPPDPKYNFLADSERETPAGETSRPEDDKNKPRIRGGAGPRRRGGGNHPGGGGSRDAFFKDNRGPQAFHSREDSLPEYEAWRAERDRIDEARINRQKTAEGNWRREWDCNKVSLEKEQPRRDFSRKDSNMYERKNNHYDNDYSNRGHGGSRTYHPSQKNYSQDYRLSHHEQPHEFKRQQPDMNSPSIAGTGRVGPRQKSRITYSSQSEAGSGESNFFTRQKSFDENIAATNFHNGPTLAPKSPFSQRKREGNPKSPYFSRKELKTDDFARSKNQSKAFYSQRNESRDQRQSNSFIPKPQRIQKRKLEFDMTDNVSVVEDSVPVEYNVNIPIDNMLDIQNNDSIENETNVTNEGISDVSNVLDNSAVNGDEVIDNIEENISINNEERVGNSSNIVTEKYAEGNHENIKKENNIDADDENTKPKQNNDSFDVYSFLVNESFEVNNSSLHPNKESVTDHEDFSKFDKNVPFVIISGTSSTETDDKIIANLETETSDSVQPLDHEIKEFTQTLNDPKNEEVDIDLELEKKHNVIKKQFLENNTSKKVETEDVDNKEFIKSSTADSKTEDSKVEDNSANDLIEPEENTLTEDSFNKPENDSGFLDNVDNSSFSKTNTTSDDSGNDSAILNDRYLIEYSDNSLNIPGAENESEETSKIDKFDSEGETKDECVKAVEICDNVSAISDNALININEEKLDAILQDFMEDNDALIIENGVSSSDTSKEVSFQDANVDTVEKKVEQVFENVVENIPEELKTE